MTTCEPVVSARDKDRVIDRIRKARSSWSTYAPFLDWFHTGLSDRACTSTRLSSIDRTRS